MYKRQALARGQRENQRLTGLLSDVRPALAQRFFQSLLEGGQTEPEEVSRMLAALESPFPLEGTYLVLAVEAVPERSASAVEGEIYTRSPVSYTHLRDFGTEDRSGELGVGKLVPLSLAIGLVIGCYDGFFGPGAGTFLTLAFTGLCRFDLLTAAGNTKVANATSNLASLVTFALGGKVLWAVGIPAALFGIAGGYEMCIRDSSRPSPRRRRSGR